MARFSRASPMPMTPPNQPQHASLLAVMRQVLEPLAQLALARGLPYAALDELLRRVLVEQARQLHADTPAHGMVSRLSAATGLARREVTRLLQTPAEPAAAARSLASEVFARWLADPAYRRRGRPLPLPRTGPAPSFESLAHCVTRDVHPRTLLAELCRLELTSWDEASDQVRLRTDAYVPRADSDAMLGLLAENVGDHLHAAVDNVLGQGNAHFEQAVFADELSAQSVQALRPLLATQWSELLRCVAPELERHMTEDRAQNRLADQRVRVGFYSYAAPMPAPAPDAACTPDAADAATHPDMPQASKARRRR